MSGSGPHRRERGGCRFSRCFLVRGGYCQNLAKLPLSLSVATESRVFVLVLLLLISHFQTVCSFSSKLGRKRQKDQHPENSAAALFGSPSQAVSASPPLRDSLLLFYIQCLGVLVVEMGELLYLKFSVISKCCFYGMLL